MKTLGNDALRYTYFKLREIIAEIKDTKKLKNC